MLVKTPKGYLVRILDGKDNDITKADLILEEDFSPQISNTYEPLIASKGSVSLSAFAGAFTPLRNLGASGQIKQQGFKVWTETKPLELKLALSLYMKTSGKTDVYEPATAIMRRSVPAVADNGFGLIPPGPNVLEILGISPSSVNEVAGFDLLASSEGALQIQIGSFMTIYGAVIENAIPTFSAQKDSDGYPVKCKLDLDISTSGVVTKSMIDDWSNNQDNTTVSGQYY
jgi:hypothetical protein